jgi:LacI family transcriptional regulator
MANMTNPPTIKDVAEQSQVSVATVSRILNGLSGYSEETRKKVLKVVDEIGYKRNAVARNLKTRKTHTIGVLMPRVDTTFYVKILDGIEDIAQKFNYNVLICHVGTFIEDYLI